MRVGLEDLREVRLGLGVRLVEHRHLLAGDVDQLAALRLRRADRDVASLRQLVHRHQVLAVGLLGVAAADDQVADVEVHRDLVDDDRVQVLLLRVVPGRQRPLGDRRLDVERRVGVALAVELRVQRAEPHRHFALDHRFVLDHRDAAHVAVEGLRGDRLLDLLEVEHAGHRLQLARAAIQRPDGSVSMPCGDFGTGRK